MMDMDFTWFQKIRVQAMEGMEVIRTEKRIEVGGAEELEKPG